MSFHRYKTIKDSRVVSTCEITSTEKSYSNYLCWTVSVRTNKLQHYQNRYTSTQEETYNFIKSLKKSGMGYRKISHHLNDRGVTTSKGNRWLNTQVYSVIKRYEEKTERLKFINEVYPPKWGKMEIKMLKE